MNSNFLNLQPLLITIKCSASYENKPLGEFPQPCRFTLKFKDQQYSSL